MNDVSTGLIDIDRNLQIYCGAIDLSFKIHVSFFPLLWRSLTDKTALTQTTTGAQLIAPLIARMSATERPDAAPLTSSILPPLLNSALMFFFPVQPATAHVLTYPNRITTTVVMRMDQYYVQPLKHLMLPPQQNRI